MIEVRGLTKRFGQTDVLRGIDLVLPQGKLVGLIGPSGAGKSLLTRCIMGLETFDAGSVERDGEPLKPATERFSTEAITFRRPIGLVLPASVMLPYRTAEELILEGPIYVMGMKRADALNHCSTWIDRLGIRPHLKKYPRELSTGQLARVSLARALALRPRYLIADELTANLDPILAGEVIELIGELVSEGIGVLVVTHQMFFIRTHADSVAFLDDGQILEHGDPGEILDHPSTVKLAEFLQGIRRGR